jgi:flagellar operon protein
MSDSINNINQTSGTSRSQSTGQQSNVNQNTSSSFADALEQANVKFSNHAQKRLETRSIEMDQSSMNRLSSAVDKAQAHGAKESLILMDDLAFVVNIQDRTVVTTVDMNHRKEGVFTQIDTVVFADPSQKSSSQAVEKTDSDSNTEVENINSNQE